MPAEISFFTGATEHQIPYGSIAAASLVISVPLILLVLLFQKRIVGWSHRGRSQGLIGRRAISERDASSREAAVSVMMAGWTESQFGPLAVSRLCLGTMLMGTKTPLHDAHEMLDAFIEAAVRARRRRRSTRIASSPSRTTSTPSTPSGESAVAPRRDSAEASAHPTPQ